jgi:hypothetical protein
MFIEHANPKDSLSLQQSEIPCLQLPENIALLWSAGVHIIGFYKHLGSLPAQNFGCAQAAL